MALQGRAVVAFYVSIYPTPIALRVCCTLVLKLEGSGRGVVKGIFLFNDERLQLFEFTCFDIANGSNQADYFRHCGNLINQSIICDNKRLSKVMKQSVTLRQIRQAWEGVRCLLCLRRTCPARDSTDAGSANGCISGVWRILLSIPVGFAYYFAG